MCVCMYVCVCVCVYKLVQDVAVLQGLMRNPYNSYVEVLYIYVLQAFGCPDCVFACCTNSSGDAVV